MIFEAITYVALFIFNAVLNFFPEISTATNSSIVTFYSTIRTTFSGLAWLIPTDTLFQILGAVLIIEFSVLTFKVIRWVLNLLSSGLLHA